MSARLAVLVLLAFVAACSGQENEAAEKLPTLNDAQLETRPAQANSQINSKDRADCDRAKVAAVAARKVYDRDYEHRNPGVPSNSLSVSELSSCKIGDDGTFVGKWGGMRWRFVPKRAGKYVRDPKQVWVGENEGLSDLSWFSEWRAVGASVEKNEELNGKLKAARTVDG